jgi:hypothetical protein
MKPYAQLIQGMTAKQLMTAMTVGSDYQKYLVWQYMLANAEHVVIA